MKAKLQLTVAAVTMLGAAALVDLSRGPLNHTPVVLGSHAPEEMANVWQFLTKKGARSSACPVAIDGTTVIFLTAGHAVKELKVDSIVQDRTKQRKLKVLKHLAHDTSDLGILWVKGDGKDVDLFKLDLTATFDLGLSVFAVGYPYPSFTVMAFRGYLADESGWMSASVSPAMSGGAMLSNDGVLLGIIEGHGQGAFGRRDVFDNTPAHTTIGHVHNHYDYYGQGVYVPLAPHSQWLKANKVID